MQKKIRRILAEADAYIVLEEKWNAVVKRIQPQTRTIVKSNTVKIPVNCAQWNERRFQFLFLGVLIERKGGSDLIKAIKNKDRTGMLHFVIAGTGSQEEQLKQKVRQYGVEHMFEFVGWTTGEKKKRLLLESQVFLLSSYNENLPVFILEAMSYGLPVVATNIGDISFAVHDGENRYLIEPGDIQALAERLTEISESKNKYLRMVGFSKMIAAEHFPDQRYYEQLYDCYMSMGECNIVFFSPDALEYALCA